MFWAVGIGTYICSLRMVNDRTSCGVMMQWISFFIRVIRLSFKVPSVVSQ